MQITINTSDILGDETTIREEVISQVAHALTTSMRTQAKEALALALDQSLKDTVSAVVAEAAAISVDTEFTDVDSYGRAGKTATLRTRIADHVQAQCVFKQTTYSSDSNAFTKTINELVSQEVRKFKADFTSLISKQVIEQSMNMAVETLRRSLGINEKK